MRQMSKPRLANQSGIDASGSPGICRSKPCEPMDEPWTSRIVAFGSPETERFSAMNSFLPFDWVQCSWLGTERVVMVAVMTSPVLSFVLACRRRGRVYRPPRSDCNLEGAHIERAAHGGLPRARSQPAAPASAGAGRGLRLPRSRIRWSAFRLSGQSRLHAAGQSGDAAAGAPRHARDRAWRGRAGER